MPKINGVELDHTIDNIVDSRDGRLLILGGGKCVWEDYLEARELLGKGNYDIMCVNDIAGQFKAEEIQHAVSLHKGLLPAARHLRREKSCLEHVLTHCDKHGEDIDIVWPMHNAGGTSGLFAVKVALALGYKKIIVCGTPMDGTGHYFDPLNANDNKTEKFHESSALAPWEDMVKRPIPKERVRSMSGRTKGVFGKPTKEWAV